MGQTMRVVSLSPVEAWRLVHGETQILNMPAPAPMPVCDRCNGVGMVSPSTPQWPKDGSTVIDPCPRAGCSEGSRTLPLTVAVYATDEWEAERHKLDVGDTRFYYMPGRFVFALVDGERLGRMALNAVVAVATITRSHHSDQDYDEWKPCSEWADVETEDTHHWLVGSVRVLDQPIPWKQEYSLGCPPDRIDAPAPDAPVLWDAPAELAAQIEQALEAQT